MRFKISLKAFLICSFCIALLITEAYLRRNEIYYFSEGAMSRNNIMVHHDYEPNAVFVRKPSRNDSFGPVVNRINSFGIRGPEIREKDSYRVLILGDSFVQADEVEFEDIFSERLNRHFKGKGQFISHGMASWAPTTEFSWIHNKGIKLDPDEIVLFLCANDFYRKEVYNTSDTAYQEQAIYEGSVPIGYRFSHKDGKENTPRDFLRKVFRKIRIARFLYNKTRILIANITYKKEDLIPLTNEIELFARNFSEWPPELKKSVDSCINVIADIQEYLDARGISFNVTLAPLGFEWENENIYGKKSYGWDEASIVRQAGLETYLKSEFKRLNIKYIDLFAGFKNAKKLDNETLLFNLTDCHWNSNGHEAVFRVLKEYYREL